jgi:type II secretion system protein I
MNTARNRLSGHPLRRGFTLVEALVAVAILTIGIVGAMGALGAMTRTEADARERETMQVLAAEKLEELLATGDAQNAMASGDFSDRQEDRYTWEADVQPTGVENLSALTVTVTKRRDQDNTYSIDGLMFVAPQTGGETTQ